MTAFEAALARALHEFHGEGCLHEVFLTDPPWKECENMAPAIVRSLAADPQMVTALAEAVSDALAAATEGGDHTEAPEPSDEPGSPYVLHITASLLAALTGPEP